MNGNFSNLELTITTNIYMEDSVVLITLTVSVLVNMLTVHRDVVDVQGGTLGKTTYYRLSHGVIKPR